VARLAPVDGHLVELRRSRAEVRATGSGAEIRAAPPRQ
jgi:hypothetical protein